MAFDAPQTTKTPVNASLKSIGKQDVAIFEAGRITYVSSKFSPVSTLTPQGIADTLTQAYPNIARNPDVFGGLPILRNTRFGVADVLSAICVSSALEDVVARYSNRYTQEQLKDAVRYARDFLLESLD